MERLFIISLIPAIAYAILKSFRSMHMLQQNFYNENSRYLKWIVQNPYKVFLEVDMAFIIFISFLFTTYNIGSLIFILFYIMSFYLYFKKLKTEQVKKPLAITARIRRLLVTIVIIHIIVALPMIIWFDEGMLTYNYLVIGLIIYLNYIIVWFANIINKPAEKFVFYRYKFEAASKLKKMNNLKIVGITGSYGKTSSKHIVNDILNVKYNSFKSPKNFNTLYGIINTINNYMDKFNDIFVVEMGAFHRGDIKAICNLVKPKYGILTKIGTAHLDSFGSTLNIQKGKFELIESLPNDGVAILNKDDEMQVNYKLKNNPKIIWIAVDNDKADVRATNIKYSRDGMKFDVLFKGDKNKYSFETKLLGEANIYNILAGIALGDELGLSKEELILGVRKIEVIEHRLELKKYKHVNLIDDAYNSNPIGAKMALDVLKIMPGTKIIVTPGMIELADKQYELNLEFGKQIASVCDEVILVGKDQTKPILDGLKIADFNESKIHIINDVKEAFKIIDRNNNEEMYVLLENDLPDLFNEKE